MLDIYVIWQGRFAGVVTPSTGKITLIVLEKGYNLLRNGTKLCNYQSPRISKFEFTPVKRGVGWQRKIT